MRVDYHVHSTFSVDASDTVTALCQRAVEIGLTEIAFAEHVDYEPLDEGYGFFRPDDYLAAVEEAWQRWGDRLAIRVGIEVGEPHVYTAEMAGLLEAHRFDFIIGSLHWMNGELVTSRDYFDGKAIDEAYDPYFTELVTMAESGDFDVLGHLDLPKRYGAERFGPFDPQPHARPIRAALRALVERGIGLEINASGLRAAAAETMPGLTILRWYRELGGEVLTIGTDSHSTPQLGRGLDEALDLARAAGFDAITLFEDRRPRWVHL